MFIAGDPAADTICALATARNPGHRAVVRLSGPEAIEIASTAFRAERAAPPWKGGEVVSGVVDVAGLTVDACGCASFCHLDEAPAEGRAYVTVGQPELFADTAV